jgi:hypothetical protein
MGTFAAAAACAQRATAWLESQGALERISPPDTEYARLCHFVRNRLGSLQAALEVAALSPPGSDCSQEAQAIAVRQAAALAALLADVKGATWAAR